MPIRIAHISDLHYGGSGFEVEYWTQAKQAILASAPNLIVVSGDLVEHPIRENLITAKQELDGLAGEVGARLFVVPGNHDLFVAGNNIGLGRIGCYDEVFNSATRTADAPNPAALGFEDSARGLRGTIVGLFKRTFGRSDRAPEVRAPPAKSSSPRPPLLEQPEGIPVLLALLDSNATDQQIGLATGSISSEHLQALDGELNADKIKKMPHLLRIAVVHHHVLPIAYTAGGVVGAEPFMVLHNAGDLLAVLARHCFDLVLHGHKHRAQFARIDFAPHSAAGYPIAVAAAGSPTLRRHNEPRANSFNMITVHENGRIVVESLHFGQGVAPQLNASVGEALTRYSEPLESVKRRAFIRACQRHSIICDLRQIFFRVTESGDLYVTHHANGLRLLSGSESYRRCRHDVFLAEYGRLVLDLDLDAESKRNGYQIDRQDQAEGQTLRRMVVLPESLGGSRQANYVVNHACANSIIMTRWEAEERARAKTLPGAALPAGWDEEWVGMIVKSPVEEIVLNLVLPESLAAATPYISCYRPSTFPVYGIDELTKDCEVTPETQWEFDGEMRDEEARYLSYVPEKGCWKIVIRRPLVSYRYRLLWELPGLRPDEPLPSQTEQARQLLVRAADRAEANALLANDAKISLLFGELGTSLEQLLGSHEEDERRVVELFVYDGGKLALRPVLRLRDGQSDMIPLGFGIPLGDGLAGAAFQQRLTLPWAHNANALPFIVPVPYPGEPTNPFRTMLAVPVYHPAEQNEHRPSPWAAICVVSFGSSSLASKIPPLLNQTLTAESNKLIKAIRGLCQAGVNDILQTLHGGAAA
jgi:3',5'-cyclic AMP phosphodiesterase CpdA